MSRGKTNKRKSRSMDQQRKNTKSEILDLSYLSHNKDIAWHGNSEICANYVQHLRTEEELKIRQELEMDIERDLEQEIKDGIYHLALRLHRLYQHRKERSSKRELTSKELETLISEVNINIKMEGETKIEIKETKKDQPLPQKLVRPPSLRSSDNLKSMHFVSKKKFDWINSLRSDSGPVIMHKKIHGNQASLVSNEKPKG